MAIARATTAVLVAATIDALRPLGIGDLYLQFEQLKAALEAEGLFDAERKRVNRVRFRREPTSPPAQEA